MRKATQILRAGRALPTQRDNPRKRGPGKAVIWAKSAHRPRPRWRFSEFFPYLPAKPSAAGSPGRGGARERAQFSPSGGNGDKRTQGELVRRAKRRWPGPLRRRWGAPNGAYKRFVPRTKPWRKGGSAALSISIPTGPRKMEHFAGPIPWPSSPPLWPETEILPQVLLAGPHTGGPLFCAPPGAAGGFSRKIHSV